MKNINNNLILDDKSFIKLTSYMKQKYGVELGHKRNLVEGRLKNRVIEKGFDSFSAYIDYAMSLNSGLEMIDVIHKLTTHYTFFMREWEQFQYYTTTVLPYLQYTLSDKAIRLWSTGCSTGEEPYTLAILNKEFFSEESKDWDTRILATDLSERVIDTARKGVYLEEGLKNLPKGWKNSYFRKLDEERWQVKEEIRQQVIYRPFNLMSEDYYFKSPFHVIFCRNVMIYFNQATKIEVIKKLYDVTATGGYLFIGRSESIMQQETEYRYVQPGIYRKE